MRDIAIHILLLISKVDPVDLKGRATKLMRVKWRHHFPFFGEFHVKYAKANAKAQNHTGQPHPLHNKGLSKTCEAECHEVVSQFIILLAILSGLSGFIQHHICPADELNAQIPTTQNLRSQAKDVESITEKNLGISLYLHIFSITSVTFDFTSLFNFTSHRSMTKGERWHRRSPLSYLKTYNIFRLFE